MPTQPIGHLIENPRFVAQRECELLQVGHLFGIALVKMGLTINVLESLMIGVEHKLLVCKIVAPMFDGLDNGIKFQVISGILELSPIRIFTKESNGPLFLAKDTSNTQSRCITIKFKGLVKIWLCQNWSLGKQLLQKIEAITGFLAPLRNFKLENVGQRGNDATKVSDKSPIESSQTMKTSYFLDTRRSGPFHIFFDLLHIHKHPTRIHNISQEDDLVHGKGALLSVAIELVSP